MRRIFTSVVSHALNALRSAWQIAFPIPPDGSGAPPSEAKAAALREGALLSENVDAISKTNVA
jgi:hypothetical protein